MATLTGSGELKIGYKGKMFNQPVCKYTLDHVIPDGDSPEEGKLLKAAYQKLWTDGFEKLAKERAAAIKKAMDDTEKAIAKKPPTDMKVFLETANKLIQQGIDVWRQVEIVKLAEQCLEKVYAAVEAKLKKKMNRDKAKCVMKIVVLVLITLAIAAVSIAATVLTGGALAPIVLVAIGTGVGALIASGKTIKKEYDSYQGFLDKVEKDIAEMQKAMDYQIKKETAAKWRALGPKEKIKLAIGGVGPIAKSLRKNLADAEGRMLLTRKHMMEALGKANEAQENFDKMSSHMDPVVKKAALEGNAEVQKSKRALEKFEEKKAAFDKLKTEANAQLALFEKNGEWTGGNVSKLVKFVNDHADTLSFFIDATKGMATAVSKLSKALA